MIETGAWVVVDVVRQHLPDLPCMFVDDGHNDLAGRHAPVERAYPHLLRGGLGLLTHFQDDQAKQQDAIRQERKLSRRFVARATFVLAKVAKTAGA